MIQSKPMKRKNIADNIKARNIAGHATEMTVWRFVRDISMLLSQMHGEGKSHGALTLDNILIQGKSFILLDGKGNGSAADDVWQLGACIYELVTGCIPFGARGRRGQTADSPLPAFSGAKASSHLSDLTVRCLAFTEKERITAREIQTIADEQLQYCEKYYSDMENLKYKKPQNRQIRMKTYGFWPETMVVILFIAMLLTPQWAVAQQNEKMRKLIRLTLTMRDQSKRSEVLKELKDDDSWTLMDELKMDQNECSYSDIVNMFGMNDIAAEIAQREKGIVNAGGRFKHSADGRHHYSFIELTAIAGKTISYNVVGHQGEQLIAVVPFDAKNRYTAICYSDGKEYKAQMVKDCISYFTVRVGRNGNYEFEISNNDKKNASYVVITYNPMIK